MQLTDIRWITVKSRERGPLYGAPMRVGVRAARLRCECGASSVVSQGRGLCDGLAAVQVTCPSCRRDAVLSLSEL